MEVMAATAVTAAEAAVVVVAPAMESMCLDREAQISPATSPPTHSNSADPVASAEPVARALEIQVSAETME